MLRRNASIFSKHDLDMGKTSVVKHNIILTDPIPFKEKYRTIPPQIFSEVKGHLKGMLDLGAIRDSSSPWAPDKLGCVPRISMVYSLWRLLVVDSCY